MELKDIIEPRLPSHLWDIFGYAGGLLCLLYPNKLGILIYSCLFSLYGILNMIVEIYTISFDYTNDIMPTYNELGHYTYYITNKKYKLLSKQVVESLSKMYMIDNSRLVLEVNLYIGSKHEIKYLIYWVYKLGITKRNYTLKDYTNFKDNRMMFY